MRMGKRIYLSVLLLLIQPSRPLAWWQKHIHLFDDVVASFHVEHANKERYEENSIWLCDKLNYLLQKMLLHEDRFWEVVSFLVIQFKNSNASTIH